MLPNLLYDPKMRDLAFVYSSYFVNYYCVVAFDMHIFAFLWVAAILITNFYSKLSGFRRTNMLSPGLMGIYLRYSLINAIHSRMPSHCLWSFYGSMSIIYGRIEPHPCWVPWNNSYQVWQTRICSNVMRLISLYCFILNYKFTLC